MAAICLFTSGKCHSDVVPGLFDFILAVILAFFSHSVLNMYLLAVISVFLLSFNPSNAGYIAYCPCMGRFGNQADHFLGSLGFAKGINRTLILPPWVEYRPGELRSLQVPFDTYFDIEKLKEFHDVITMEEFMTKLAPTIWPPEKRTSFCYADRGNGGGCSAKDGNPFGPFWDTFQVDFVNSEKYGPLGFDVYRGDTVKKWQTRYRPEDWPVLAFVGAPASFPVQIENRDLHKYLKWSDKIDKAADDFIKTKIPRGGFIGIHLRNGIDWVRACEHVPQSPNLFAAPQCLGYRNEHGPATQEMCYPTTNIIVRQLKRLLRQMKDVKSIFVASDSNHLLKELKEALKGFQIDVLKMDPADPHVELAVLGRAHHFVGNCISSFSAFVKRERDVRGFKTTFWGFPTEKKKPVKINDEL